MKKVGITGQAGFIGTHLFNFLKLKSNEVQLVPFDDDFFKNERLLSDWVSKCDIIVHLAAVNRHADPQALASINVGLVEKLISALNTSGRSCHIVFSSSIQEERDNPYGKSKKEARLLLSNWAKSNNSVFTGMVIPNVFGPFGNPYYNSVIATFSYQLIHKEQTKIDVDGLINLIFVGDLVNEIYNIIKEQPNQEYFPIKATAQYKVSELLEILQNFNHQYIECDIFPKLNNNFERDLFNTFRSYIDQDARYPRQLKKNEDDRGSFVETVRLGQGGLVSFSTTNPGITRGNHFHTRKIERFAVLHGKAKIQLRRIGTSVIHDFYLDGESPAFVDMPVWYTHNISNIGDDVLITLFWINEFYNELDPDTYFEKV